MEQRLSVNAGYHDLLTYAGLDILGHATFGQYQGDYLFAVHRNDPKTGHQYGISIIGYGSCSGCDQLEALRPQFGERWTAGDYEQVTSLARALANDVHWGNRIELYAKLFTDPASFTQWYRHEPSYTTKLHDVMQHIPAQSTPEVNA